MAVIISCMPLIASAAESKLNPVKPDAQNAIVVSGTIDETRQGTKLILRVLDDESNIIYADNTETVLDEASGSINFEFKKVLLPVGLETGIYTVKVSGKQLATPLTTTFEHNGPDTKFKALKNIKTAEVVGTLIAEGTVDEKTYEEILSLDLASYTALDANGKTAFEAKMTKVKAALELPEGYGTEEEIAKIQKAVDAFSLGYADAIASGEFAKADDAADIAAWIDKYYNAYSFNAETEITKVLTKVKAEADFVSRIAAKTAPLDIEEIKEFLYESALLAAICELSDDEVKSVYMDLPAYFDINRSAFGDLSNIQQAKVIEELSGTSFETCEAAANALDKKVREFSGDDGNDGGSSGGGGGGGYTYTGGLKDPATVEPEEKEETVTADVFTDLADAEWAKEAILFLNSRGVINGNPDGSFRPNDNITRAEFVKMIAAALEVEESADNTPFSDVSADSWYAPYVAAAYKWGIVNGDENGNFYPEARITRQDMVVMLYRASKAELDAANTEEIAFTDRDAISEYALDAVRYFSAKKIVNGFADGSFGALNNATRAEAAMILYNMTKATM